MFKIREWYVTNTQAYCCRKLIQTIRFLKSKSQEINYDIKVKIRECYVTNTPAHCSKKLIKTVRFLN